MDKLFLLTLAIAAGVVAMAFAYTGIVLYREYRSMRDRGAALPRRKRQVM